MTHPDINFSGDDSHRFLPWLTGIMAGLAALLLCLGLSLNSWVGARHGDYTNSFTVNIPAGEEQAEQVAKVREALAKISGVGKISELSGNQLHDMLKPWLGGGSLEDLPLPAVLEVAQDRPGALDYAAMEKALSAIAPGTEVDGHERWLTAFSDFSSAVRSLTTLLAALIIAAMVIMIAFTARASLKLHARTVHLLHSIGAADDYIVRQFQREALWLVIPGALAGCLAALFVYWGTGIYMATLGIALLPPLGITAAHAALLLLLPVVCALAAWVATRLSVASQLRRSL